MTEQDSQYATVARTIRYIRDNVSRQPNLAEIAAEVNVSEHHLQRVFSAWAGISPKRFLQYLTKEHALKLLAGSSTVFDTALETGLSGSGRLHDLILSCEAMTPGEVKSAAAGIDIRYGQADTPFGTGLFGWTEKGVCYLAFVDDNVAPKALYERWPAANYLADNAGAAELAKRIFAFTPQPGKLHLLLNGTNFQIKVWEALLNTRPGQLISYSGLAKMIGTPRAQRAVGSAVGANTLAYLIPCHRVIRESGELGNYRWGENRKSAIQVWEAAGVGA